MDATSEFRNQDSLFHWFVIASLAGVEITDNITAKPLNLTMQINGEEVNPVAAIRRLEEEHDKMIVSKAKELVEEIKRDVLFPFEDAVLDLTEKLDVLVREKFEEKE